MTISPNERPQTMIDWIANEHLWIVAMWIVPISILYDIYMYFRTALAYKFSNVSKSHEERVRDIQAQVRAYHDSGCKNTMCTSRPNWKSVTLQPQKYKNRMYNVHVDLPNILSIDEDKTLVKVEPNVTIGQLNDFLIGKGWMLPVVPELDDLTIGGLVMGGGIESTSHKYGLFQYICKSYEMVMADASIMWCSKDVEHELYAAIPFCYGTLGFLTMIELDIVPYKPYIKLNYEPVYSLDEVVNEFTRVTNDPKVDSVEGIMYSLDTAVIMNGTFVDQVEDPSKLNRMGLWYKPWFYKYVEEVLNTGRKVEYIPTVDFFHRQNKSYFWLIRYVFPFANNIIFRFLFGWAMPPKFSFLKLSHQMLVDNTRDEDKMVIQDFGYNLHELKEGLQFVDEATKVYPLWLCPTRHVIPKEIEHLIIFSSDEVHVDVGIYGKSPIPNYDYNGTQRRMERYAAERKSYVALYAEVQLTRDEFENMFEFNLRNYYKMRKRFQCDGAFPHVYDKVSKKAREQ